MADQLGYEPHAVEGRGSRNSRDGTDKKTLKTKLISRRGCPPELTRRLHGRMDTSAAEGRLPASHRFLSRSPLAFAFPFHVRLSRSRSPFAFASRVRIPLS